MLIKLKDSNHAYITKNLDGTTTINFINRKGTITLSSDITITIDLLNKLNTIV